MKAEEVMEVDKITNNKNDNKKTKWSSIEKDDCYEGGIGVKAGVRAVRVYHRRWIIKNKGGLKT
jgi:hypothetical protein